MLYLPFPFKQCTKCKENFLPTIANFGFLKDRGVLRNWCRKCQSEASHQWSKNNPDKRKKIDYNRYHANPKAEQERSRKWHKKHPEKSCQWAKQWKAANPDKHKDAVRRHNNKESVRKRQHENYTTNPMAAKERARQWRQNNPKRLQIHAQARIARKKSLPTTFTVTDWQYALDYFRNTCAYCGSSSVNVLDQDHFVPVALGGGYTPDNIVPACSKCNNNKRASSVERWLKHRFGSEQAEAILQHINEYFHSLKGA